MWHSVARKWAITYLLILWKTIYQVQEVPKKAYKWIITCLYSHELEILYTPFLWHIVHDKGSLHVPTQCYDNSRVAMYRNIHILQTNVLDPLMHVHIKELKTCLKTCLDSSSPFYLDITLQLNFCTCMHVIEYYVQDKQEQ